MPRFHTYRISYGPHKLYGRKIFTPFLTHLHTTICLFDKPPQMSTSTITKHGRKASPGRKVDSLPYIYRRYQKKDRFHKARSNEVLYLSAAQEF